MAAGDLWANGVTKLDVSTKAAASVESWVPADGPPRDVFFQVADFEITVAKQHLPLQNKMKPKKRLQPAVGLRPAPPLPLGHDHGVRKTLGITTCFPKTRNNSGSEPAGSEHTVHAAHCHQGAESEGCLFPQRASSCHFRYSENAIQVFSAPCKSSDLAGCGQVTSNLTGTANWSHPGCSFVEQMPYTLTKCTTKG